MFENDYKNELDSISASEKFKEQTIALMYEKQNRMTKSIKFTKRRYAVTAASIAIMLLAAAVGFISKSDYFITVDQATEEHNQPVEFKEADTDSLPDNASQMPPFMRRYGIDDAVEISATEQADRLKAKLYFDGSSNGGMGFEGYLFYQPWQMIQGSAYHTGDTFDSLPVYQCIKLSPREVDSYIKQYINQLGFDYSSLNYDWSMPVFDKNGNLFTEENITTDTAVCPEEGYSLFCVRGNLVNDDGTTAQLWRWPASGTVGVIIDQAFTESENVYDVSDAAFRKYPAALDKGTMDSHSRFDYNLYGQPTYDLYAYEKSDDYGENLFNSTLNNITFSQYKKYDEDTQPTASSFHFTLPAYSKIAQLPAIDYKQALWLLYNGNFYSSYSDTISKDATVSHIDIVYRSPEYDMATKVKKGYALPFYKFYVELGSDFDHITDDGVLKTYAAYYVCAIHPEYVQLDESYFHYN